jgi:pimeloyl-ACP methyl ester carboxylesterase
MEPGYHVTLVRDATAASELEQSGFRGPLNCYRNNDRDFAFLRGFEGRRIEQPTLYIGGERDTVPQMFGDRLPVMRSAFSVSTSRERQDRSGNNRGDKGATGRFVAV